MKTHMMMFLLVALLGTALAGSAGATAIVLVSEDGGFDPSTVQTVRTIASTELRVRGVAVTDDPRSHATLPLTDAVLQDMTALGVERLFVLRLGRLGEKVMISLEELLPPHPSPLFASTLTAQGIEEADTVIPRLVRSVLERVPPEKTAEIATVTAQESKAFNKRPGEGLFLLGLGVAPLGGSIGWSYEARTWRLGVLYQGAEDDPPFLGFEGAWVPLEGQTSPYVGGGFGIVWPASDGSGDGELGGKLDVGVEFMRLHRMRLLVGATAVIPFAGMSQTEDVSPELWIRFGL